MLNGYVSYLRSALDGDRDVVIKQLSVGGTTTLTAIGRLYDTFCHEKVDVVLYEYAINDWGHFSPRPNGFDSFMISYCMLVNTLAELYPSAILVPVLLQHELCFDDVGRRWFSDRLVTVFSDLGMPFVNVGGWLNDFFMNMKPSWLYHDPAHYSEPAAVSLIGNLVAREVLDIEKRGAEEISSLRGRLADYHWAAGLKLSYVPARDLLKFVEGGRAELMVYENRLIKVEHLRICAGAGLSLNRRDYPFVLYVKSDSMHRSAHLSLSNPSGGTSTYLFSTKHFDVGGKPTVFSSIPVPFLFGHELDVDYPPTSLCLRVPVELPAEEPFRQFDCFVDTRDMEDPGYLDVSGILFVSR